MRVSNNSFRGEVPRVTPRALPENAAQDAANACLLTGDLQAWKQFGLTKVLANGDLPVQTIYKLNGAWLSWSADVDVARGAIAGDTTYRIFMTGPDVYDAPQFSNYAMATTGSEPYPVETRPLGVPPPDSPPTAVAGVDPNPTSFNVDVFDEGDSLAANWTISPVGSPDLGDSNVSQSASFGDPPPSYQVGFGRNVGVPAYLYRDFGISALTAVRVSFDFMCRPPTSGESYKQMYAKIANSATGVGMFVLWDPSGALAVGNSLGWNTTSGSVLVSTSAVGVPLANTWYRCEVQVIQNADVTQTVTATLYLGSVQLGAVTVTNSFAIGSFCGFVGETGNDSDASPFWTYYDNILVQGSGSTGYNPQSTATNYVYTFVNDLGQESAPSIPSNTVLRPSGIAITVTTPTAVPTGTDSEYGITTKAIYRAVSGNTGTVYLFVAEIPLAQAEYTDVLADTELGDALESENWDLPPADLRGILALPNGIMAGFSKNQLCLSAQNHPHAWPVAYRLTVDTDIVAIGNIDATVVVGTQNFPYLATGTDPAAFGMTKLEVPQACTSKRSLAYLIGIGVVFASPDGLIAITGNGQVRNLTSTLFTREQWQALTPSSIVGVAHDDIYHFFYDNDVPAPVPQVQFFDAFTGTADTLLTSHAQNTPLNGSVWTAVMGNDVPVLDGSGAAVNDLGNESASSVFTDFGSAPLVAGWQLQIDLTPLSHVVNSANGATRTVFTFGTPAGDLVISFRPNTGELGSELRIFYPGSDDLGGWGVFDGYQIFVITFSATSYTLSLNGVGQGTFTCPYPTALEDLTMALGCDTDDPEFPSASVDRVYIYGATPT